MKKYTMQQLAKNANYEIKSKLDEERLKEVYLTYCISYAAGNSGAYGRAIEVLSRRPKSRKMTVAAQHQSDCTFRLDNKLVSFERKTNGGRVDSIRDKFIVYSLHVHNSTANIDIEPKIILTEIFLEKLYEFNAIKQVSHKGKVDGLAVQPSNRKLWAWLDEQLTFNREWDYYTEDFEG